MNIKGTFASANVFSEVGTWIYSYFYSYHSGDPQIFWSWLVSFTGLCYKDICHKRPIGVQYETHQNGKICFQIWPWINCMQSVHHLQLVALLERKASKEINEWKVLSWRNHPSGFFSVKSRAELSTKFISWELLLIHENSWTEVDAKRRKIVCTASIFWQ